MTPSVKSGWSCRTVTANWFCPRIARTNPTGSSTTSPKPSPPSSTTAARWLPARSTSRSVALPSYKIPSRTHSSSSTCPKASIPPQRSEPRGSRGWAEGFRDGFVEGAAFGPVAVRGGPVEAVRLAVAGDHAANEDVAATGRSGVGELPVSGLLEVVHRLDPDALVVVVAVLTGRFLLTPVGDRVRLRLVGLVDQEETGAARLPEVHPSVLPVHGPAGRHSH